jgi:lipopolysaccharide/colanic/teichoic acid biosynthesis glycosyltransferase
LHALMNSYPKSTIKRVLDLVLSVALAPFAMVLVFLGCIAVFITDGGPVIYKQLRVGLGGKPFTMYKLRTLKLNAKDDLSGMRKNDPDIIWVGWVLRAWRIDELPQIYNILRGEMSWVGPRPERPHIVDQCILNISNYSMRHEVLPGITGLAQIKNPSATPSENSEKLQYDLEYLRRASLGLDLKIVWKTLVAIG